MTSPTVGRRPLWHILLLGFAAMFLQDLLGTAMVIFESHYQAALAAVMDELQWLTVLATSAVALGSILKDGWRSPRSLAIIAAISAANIAGTFAGVNLARGWA